MKQIAVIGLGRFGMSLVQSLAENKCQVLAIDSNMELVKKAQGFVTQAVMLDARDPEALKSLKIVAYTPSISVINIRGRFRCVLLFPPFLSFC